jgi:hypothetical protein
VNYTASTSSAVLVTITPRVVGTVASSTNLSGVTPNLAPAGTAVTLSGAVASASGSGAIPTGSVTIYSNGTAIGVAVLAPGGQFSFSSTSLSQGTDVLYAAYLGDTTYAISSSATQSITVTAPGTLLPSVTTLTSSLPNPAEPSTSITIQGKVAATFTANTVPTGTVSVLDNGVSLGSATLQSDGTFSLEVSGLALGENELTAAYTGDSVYAAGTSAALIQTIAASIAVPTVTKASVPATVVAGVKFKGTVPVTITNYGALSKGKFAVQLYVNQASTLDGDQVQVGTITRTLSLKDRKSGAVRFALSALPASLPAGTYYVLAEVVNPTGVSGMVVLSQPVEVEAPVIALNATTSAVAPSSLKAGKAGSIVISIVNSGNITAVGAMDLSLTLAGQSIPLVSIAPKMSIKAGQTRKVKLTFKLPTALAAGSYVPDIRLTLDGALATAQGAMFSVG